MTRPEPAVALPPIPAKRYFTIGEVSDLCGVKPHVLRYWEQEFTQLKPVKRRGNRRYYQHHEVLLIRRIRSLLYEQGFTISGARNRLGDTRDVPPLDQDAAVRLSGTEMQSLRAELHGVSAVLAEALSHLPGADDTSTHAVAHDDDVDGELDFDEDADDVNEEEGSDDDGEGVAAK
jgi:DNA-binding transcriptional MerR regulator